MKFLTTPSTNLRLVAWVPATLLISPVALAVLAALAKAIRVHRAGYPLGYEVLEMLLFGAAEFAVVAFGVALPSILSVRLMLRLAPSWDRWGPLIALAIVTSAPFAVAYRFWWGGIESLVGVLALASLFTLWPRFVIPSLRLQNNALHPTSFAGG